ncbi:WD40-repeat-containing domain protein [Pavlovales sp. CCMP2436]|nr:WD40-repeat-containing domain protein [Pavlovales sp. CCMP2436]
MPLCPKPLSPAPSPKLKVGPTPSLPAGHEMGRAEDGLAALSAPLCVGFHPNAHAPDARGDARVSALVGTLAGFVSGGSDGQIHLWTLAEPRDVGNGRVRLARARSFALGLDGSSVPTKPAPRPTEQQLNRQACALPAPSHCIAALPGLGSVARPQRAGPSAARRAIRSLDVQPLEPSTGGTGQAASLGQVFAGTVGGEVWRVAGERAERLYAAHAQRVDAVAPHPSQPVFASAGWDGRVCLWDARAPSRSPRTWQLPSGASSVCFGQPDGAWLCAGLKTGAVLTASTADLAVLSEARAGDGTAPALAVACSPSGGLLAVACGRAVDVFRVGERGELLGLVARCRGSSSVVRTIDWLAPPTQVRDPFERPDVGLGSWHTWTSPLGFAVMGIWPDGANASGVNRVSRSGDGRLIVTSDDQSHLKLFAHPCVVEDAPFSGPYFAHASHVPAAVFLHGDEYVASAGGSDRTVMLWRVVGARHAQPSANVVAARAPRPNDPPQPNKWRPAAYGKPHQTANLYARR